jgi:hypothetical protein
MAQQQFRIGQKRTRKCELVLPTDSIAWRNFLLQSTRFANFPGAIGTLMNAYEHSFDQIALTLTFSALHDERWVWQTIPFEITHRVYKQGLIDELRSHRKSV